LPDAFSFSRSPVKVYKEVILPLPVTPQLPPLKTFYLPLSFFDSLPFLFLFIRKIVFTPPPPPYDEAKKLRSSEESSSVVPFSFSSSFPFPQRQSFRRGRSSAFLLGWPLLLVLNCSLIVCSLIPFCAPSPLFRGPTSMVFLFFLPLP